MGVEGSAEEWCQTEVVMGEQGPLQQRMVPITDQAIGHCMQMPGWQAAMNLFVRPGMLRRYEPVHVT